MNRQSIKEDEEKRHGSTTKDAARKIPRGGNQIDQVASNKDENSSAIWVAQRLHCSKVEINCDNNMSTKKKKRKTNHDRTLFSAKVLREIHSNAKAEYPGVYLSRRPDPAVCLSTWVEDGQRSLQHRTVYTLALRNLDCHVNKKQVEEVMKMVYKNVSKAGITSANCRVTKLTIQRTRLIFHIL